LFTLLSTLGFFYSWQLAASLESATILGVILLFIFVRIYVMINSPEPSYFVKKLGEFFNFFVGFVPR